jgi:hypothetical protein
MKGEEDFSLSKSLKHLIQTLMERKKSISKEKLTYFLLIQLYHTLVFSQPSTALPRGLSFTSLLSLPVAPSRTGFTHFPIGSHVFLPLLLPATTSRSTKITFIHVPLGLGHQPVEKANAIADCLEHQFTRNDLCDENQEELVMPRPKAVLETV